MQSETQFDVAPKAEDQPRTWLYQCGAWRHVGICSSRPYDSMTWLIHDLESDQVQRRHSISDHVKGASSLKLFGSEAMGAVILSAVAGYVDTAGFMALFGLFTAHITGDLVTAGTSLTERLRFGAGTRLVMIPIFMVSVAVTTLFARALSRSGKGTLAPMLGLLTLALAIFAITGATLHPLADAPDAWAVGIIGGAGVVAMGIQNTLMRNVLSSYSPTTLMTGNLTQCTIDLVEMALPDPANDTQGRILARGAASNRLKKFGLPLLGFMTGAFSGAWLTHAVGLASIFAPTLAVGWLAVLAWLSTSQAPARVRRWVHSRVQPRSVALSLCACARDVCTSPVAPAASLPVCAVTKLPLRPAPARSGTYPNLRPPGASRGFGLIIS